MVGALPILIIGMNRSGTTLLSLMLDSHSRIAIPYESHFFVPYYRNRQGFDLTGNEGRLELVSRILAEPYVQVWDQQLSPAEIDLSRCTGLAETINEIYSTYARRLGKDLWGDKTPAYISDIDVLNALFPAARFIHIVRDGRDVSLSILKQWWGANNFLSAMQHWTSTVTCARKMLAMLPQERWLEVRFEDLVSEPERELRRVTDFLGLKFQPAMLSAYRSNAAHKVGEAIKQHHVHLREQPSASQAFKWRQALGPADQAVAFEVAGPLLTELGYPPGVTSHPLRILRKCYHRLREAYYYRIACRQVPQPPAPRKHNARRASVGSGEHREKVAAEPVGDGQIA
jgi:Sulfotransferase family